MFRASKLNEQPSQTQASISRPLHSKNTPVPTLWREQHVPIYLFAILNTQYIIIWIVTNSSEPLSNFFFSLTRQLAALYHLKCLASLRLQNLFWQVQAAQSAKRGFGRLLRSLY